jgi:DNA-binding CsgD family transcriptional regulator
MRIEHRRCGRTGRPVSEHHPELARRAFEAVAGLRAAADLGELDRVVAPVFAGLGFSHFAAGRFFAADRSESAGLLHGRLPVEWVRRYVARGYGRRSSIARELLVKSKVYSWSGAVARSGDPAGRRIWDEARDFGLNDGLYVPMRGADGAYHAVVMAGERPDVRDPFVRIVAEVLSAEYGARGARLLAGSAGPRPLLTSRQRECLLWVREGKSSPAIGTIIGLSGATVDEHIGAVCRKLGVRTRVQAVVEANRLGLLDCS